MWSFMGGARYRRWEELWSRWWGLGEALFRCGLLAVAVSGEFREGGVVREYHVRAQGVGFGVRWGQWGIWVGECCCPWRSAVQ